MRDLGRPPISALPPWNWLPLWLVLCLFSTQAFSQDSETVPPPRRPRDTPEDRLLTSLDFLEIRMRQQQSRARADEIQGPKEADVEDLRASEKVLGEMAKAKRALENRKPERALEHLKRAALLDPKYSKAWNNLGLLYQAMGRIGEAETALRKAVEANQANATAQKNLGFLYLAAGRDHDALKPLSAASSLAPDDPRSAALLGEALFRVRRLSDAAAAFERARTLAPGYAPVAFRLGCIYAEQERFPEALALLQQAAGSKHPEIDAPGVERILTRLRQIMQRGLPSPSDTNAAAAARP